MDEIKIIACSDVRYHKLRKAVITGVYVLASDYTIELDELTAMRYAGTNKYSTYENGRLTIKAGYCWDGPSGPSIDTSAFIHASLVHDALYGLMQSGAIPATEKNRLYADNVMKALNIMGGMSYFRAWYTWKAVRVFGKKHAVRQRKVYIINGKRKNSIGRRR